MVIRIKLSTLVVGSGVGAALVWWLARRGQPTQPGALSGGVGALTNPADRNGGALLDDNGGG